MPYTGLQRTLISKAGEYAKLGYKIGYCRGKEFLGERKQVTSTVMTMFGPYQTTTDEEAPEDFNGISVIPEGFVCVDLDVNDFGVIWMGALPPTWKERTPRGWHLFYNIPAPVYAMGHRGTPPRTTKIKWQPHVDLLIKDEPTPNKVKRRSPYGGMKEDGSPWGEHVLISPTPGYSLRYPEEYIPKDKLTMAPQWLVDALEKP